MREFERVLLNIRKSGDLKSVPKGMATLEDMDEISQAAIKARFTSHLYEEFSTTDVAFCILEEITDKYKMSPIDTVFLTEAVTALIVVERAQTFEAILNSIIDMAVVDADIPIEPLRMQLNIAVDTAQLNKLRKEGEGK